MATISGIIKDQNLQPLSGVNVRITQSATLTINLTTDANGQYSQNGIPAYTGYTQVYPTKTGYTFSPSYVNWSKLGSTDTKTANFTGYSYSVSGSVKTITGEGIDGATIAVYSNGVVVSTLTTNSLGNYSVSGLPGSVKTQIVPSKTGYKFTPANFFWSATNFTGNKVANFTGLSHKISGTIKDSNGVALPDVTVKVYSNSALFKTVITNSSGDYTADGLPGSVGTQVLPSKTGYKFTPANFYWSALNFTEDKIANFTASSFNVSGYIRKGDGSGLRGVKVVGSQSGLAPVIDYTDPTGFYELTGFPGFTQTTITPTKTRCTFSPTYKSWTATDFNTNKVQNFTPVCPELFSVSGQITGPANPSAGVSVDLLYNNEVVDTTITNSGGYYTLVDVALASYKIRPRGSLCSFVPSEQTLQVTGNVTNVNFTSDCVTIPVPVLNASPLYGAAPLTVSFDASASYDPGGHTVTYLWNFGDGNTSTESIVDHLYDTNGTFEVTLTVSAAGQQANATTRIVVGMPVKDTVTFKSGPLRGQCFPLLPEPLGEDSIGKYFKFQIPLNYKLSSAFSSSDDQYDIKWFLTDLEDPGLIGDFVPPDQTSGAFMAIKDRTIVDQFLNLPAHINNGIQAPTANPCLATARNYMNNNDEGQFVYLAYQALEDERWKIYLRQIRLSEYNRQKLISQAANRFVTLTSLGINEVVYRVVCINDSCESSTVVGSDSKLLLTRSITMEVLLPDGREVYNKGYSGSWEALCDGVPTANFPKEKVFVKLNHSSIIQGSNCDAVTEEDFDSIFYNWEVGQEYPVPVASLSPESLFYLLSIRDDTAIGPGTFGDPPVEYPTTWVYSSSVVADWYNSSSQSEWSTLYATDAETLQEIKGIDISEPILISTEESGNCTNPVVKVDYNNNVYIVYEASQTSGTQQIVITGTAIPGSFLPDGINPTRSIDDTLNYFLSPQDFIYRNNVTISEHGINQLPDMFIDLNNVINLTWQSNRDDYWEVYYANSADGFIANRLTNSKSRSLKPKISGDDIGNLFVTWHDDRYGGWEIMLAYRVDNRTLPLMQQDPYLASERNGGYTHYQNGWVPFVLTNTNIDPICIKKIKVDFYKNRLFENSQFSLTSDQYPIAFEMPNAQNDTTSFIVDFSTYTGSTGVYTLNEYDSGLPLSQIVSFSLQFTGVLTLDIAFRASEIENDPNASLQWTDYATVSAGYGISFDTLGLPSVVGRYKQIRFNLSSAPTFEYCSIESRAEGRLCLSSGESTTVYFNLNPEVNAIETHITLPYENNQTYFIRPTAYDENDALYIMDDPKTTVAYQSSSSPELSWASESCTLAFVATNTGNEVRYFNFIVNIYQDPDKIRRIAKYEARTGGDLDRFLVNDGRLAQSSWEASGLPIIGDTTSYITFIPDLVNSGLRCGVTYYITVESCDVVAGGACQDADYAPLNEFTWICDCLSERWTTDNQPVKLSSINRWKSSGYGFSDTRITDTRALDGTGGITTIHNLNPSIQIRSNLNGIIMYQSNRNADSPLSYSIYASVFNMIPSYDMYASGSQNITSKGLIVARTDIPINSTPGGMNATFDIDAFDNLFSAWEKPASQTECSDFDKNKQQTINVHRCSVTSADVIFGSEVAELIEGTTQAPSAVLDSTFLGDSTFDQIVQMFRVKNEDIDYHVYRENQPIPVVSHCSIRLIIVGTPECVGLRLRNGTDEWSEWKPFEPLIGDYTMEVDWVMSSGSELKSISMQIATPAGLGPAKTILVAADYAAVNYTVAFYKLPQEATFSDASMDMFPFIDESVIFTTDNLLKSINGFPVAGLRPPTVDGEELVFKVNDYIFIEIVPDQNYIANVGLINTEPSFDVLMQGGNDRYNLKTYHVKTDAGMDAYRGVFKIQKEGISTALDGLANVVIHFKDDCTKPAQSGSSVLAYNKDKYNVIQNLQNTVIQQEANVWEEERDRLGKILHQIQIRPAEDPYFVFGDPNYRFKNE